MRYINACFTLLTLLTVTSIKQIAITLHAYNLTVHTVAVYIQSSIKNAIRPISHILCRSKSNLLTVLTVSYPTLVL